MSLASNHVPPRMSMLDHADLAVGNTEAFSYSPLDHTSGNQALDFANVLLGELSPSAFTSFTNSDKPEPDRVPLIMAGVGPFEIISSIVTFVAVFMVNLRPRRRAEECFGHKSMHRSAVALASAKYRHRVIAEPSNRMPQDSRFGISSLGASERPDAAKRANLVEPVSSVYFTPFFMHWRLSPCL